MVGFVRDLRYPCQSLQSIVYAGYYKVKNVYSINTHWLVLSFWMLSAWLKRDRRTCTSSTTLFLHEDLQIIFPSSVVGDEAEEEERMEEDKRKKMWSYQTFTRMRSRMKWMSPFCSCSLLLNFPPKCLTVVDEKRNPPWRREIKSFASMCSKREREE